MSSIFISVGQCGNQLGDTLLDYLNQNRTKQAAYLFDYFDGKYHSINIDSEIKVLNTLKTNHGSRLRSDNVIATRCGRGSNWACGYTGLAKDGGSSKLIDKTIDAIRAESERCDFLLNFVLMHSLSGGTGSGASSKLVEQLREHFGAKKYILTQSVAPFKDGEIPLQHYNNLLCLSHLHEYVDFIGLHQNDDVLDILDRQTLHTNRTNKSNFLPPLKSKSAFSADEVYNPISFHEMNSYILKSFLNCIYPIGSVSSNSQSIGLELAEMQRILCSDKNLKLVELYTLDTSSNSNMLIKNLLNLIPKYRKSTETKITSLNSLIIARGKFEPANNEPSTGVDQLIAKEFDLITKSLNPVAWNPFAIDCWTSKCALNYEPTNNRKSNSYDFDDDNGNYSKQKTTTTTTPITASLTIATNRNKCVDYLSEVLNKSWTKYQHKAYLHWYEKYSIGREHFAEAFENLTKIIESYKFSTSTSSI